MLGLASCRIIKLISFLVKIVCFRFTPSMTVCTRTSKCTRTRFTLCTIVIVVVVVVCVLLVIAGALLAFRYRQLLPKWVFMSKNDEGANNPKEYRLM